MDSRIFLALVLAVHALVAVAVTTAGLAEVFGAMQLQLVLLVFLFLAAIALLFGTIARRRSARPARAMARILWARRHRYGEGALFLLALAAMTQLYMMLKIAIPQYVPFYADPWLANADALLFGRDPWRLTHAVFGPEATWLLDKFYLLPCALVTFGMTLWACFSADRAFSRRCVVAITLAWFVIGNWAALALSSAGPVYVEHFYGDPRFAELTRTLSPDLIAVQTQGYLLSNFGAAGFGKGISAMPSMHNALYLLLICMVWNRFGNGWRTWLAIAFEGTVFVASVHLGWHYALDGIVAALLVPPIWIVSGKIERFGFPTLPRKAYPGALEAA